MYVPLGNAVLAGLGAVISQHVLVDGLRSHERRTHLFAQRAYHCGLAPYEGMRGVGGVGGGTLAGVVAFGHGGIVAARTMTFAAGYPKFVLAPIAPKGRRGCGGYDSGYYKKRFQLSVCKQCVSFSHIVFGALAETQS